MNGYNALLNTINRVRKGEDPNDAAEAEIQKMNTENDWLNNILNDLPDNLIFADLDAA
jgi:hypothetical protein